MKKLTITRAFKAPVAQVWAIVGNPGVSPGPGIDVRVERPGAADGTGLTRTVKVGLVTAHEEITGVGPGRTLRYRMVKGAPVHDYTGTVTLAEAPAGGTLVSWAVEFRPVVPGTGWAVSLLTKHTLDRVLDAIAKRSGNEERSNDVDTSRS